MRGVMVFRYVELHEPLFTKYLLSLIYYYFSSFFPSSPDNYIYNYIDYDK